MKKEKRYWNIYACDYSGDRPSFNQDFIDYELALSIYNSPYFNYEEKEMTEHLEIIETLFEEKFVDFN
jgi:hypothetical protein